MGKASKSSWGIRIVAFVVHILLVDLLSCSEGDSITSADSYFPLRIGLYQLYDVERTTYSAFNNPQVTRFKLSHEITASFTNTTGGISYLCSRKIRFEAGDWEPLENWVIRYEPPYFIVSEGNVAYARLIKPLGSASQWNGNQFNSGPEEWYRVTGLGNAFSLPGGNTFDNTVTVIQEDLNELTKTDQRKEVYALNKGLVYKESKVVTYACSGGICTGTIVGGFEEKMVLTEIREQ